jgi:hypothetical protein
MGSGGFNFKKTLSHGNSVVAILGAHGIILARAAMGGFLLYASNTAGPNPAC